MGWSTPAYLKDEGVVVHNTPGSSAGAGSGEFHLYRQQRRREGFRLAKMEWEARKKEEEDSFTQRQTERQEKADTKTSKKAEKRKKLKEKTKESRKKQREEEKTAKRSGTTSSDSKQGEDSDESSDEENDVAGAEQNSNSTKHDHANGETSSKLSETQRTSSNQ